MGNERFFEIPSDQSLIKQEIVHQYFGTWKNVIKKGWEKSIPIAYVDLFCGPGKYENGTESVPLRVVRTVLEDPELCNRIKLIFNDENSDYIDTLEKSIEEIDSEGVLKGKIDYFSLPVDSDFHKRIRIGTTDMNFIIHYNTRSIISFLRP